MNTTIVGPLTEKLVTERWQHLLATCCGLKTESGQRLAVIYPGKASDGLGSDFQDAVIEVDGETIRGNIEVHVKTSDWRAHGHHQNPSYNGVVLHVAMRHDRQLEVELQNGTLIPTVIIDNQFVEEPGLANSTALPCSGIATRSGEHLLEIIEAAGNERFQEKAARFQSELEQIEAGECLYRGIMEALGYSRNMKPFLTLAQRIPLAVLESLPLDCPGLYHQALLLGTAGFLPSQGISAFLPDDQRVNNLEILWKSLPHKEALSPFDWQVFRVRPGNSPVRRMAGFSELILRYHENGLLYGLIKLVSTVPLANSAHQLEAGLMVVGDDYWADHFAFGRRCPGLGPWLIGKARADEIIINIILPFAFAWAKVNGQTELINKTFSLYCSYPSLETNTKERHMKTQFGMNGRHVNSARRQQGLLHLYKNWCTRGRCTDCAVAKV